MRIRGTGRSRVGAGGGGLSLFPSATFNGTADYVSMGDVEDVGTNDWSVAGWFKTTGTGLRAILTKNPNAGNDRWGLYVNSGQPLFILQTTAGFNLNSTATGLNNGVWQHHAVTLDRDGLMTHYSNGVVAGTLDISSEVARDISNTTALRIGRSDAEFWLGQLVDVRLFHVLLTPAQVLSVMGGQVIGSERVHTKLTDGSGTTAADASGNGNDGTITATDINAFWANTQPVYKP